MTLKDFVLLLLLIAAVGLTVASVASGRRWLVEGALACVIAVVVVVIFDLYIAAGG